MKLKKSVALSESGLLFNPVTGESFSVNPIGVEILNLLREEKGEKEIRKALLERYSSDEATIEKDLQDFFGILNHQNLLETNDKANL